MTRFNERMIAYTRVITINLIIFLILLFAINSACWVYLKNTREPSRSELPNYESERTYARKIFKEYNKVKQQYEPFTEWKALPFQGETTNILGTGERIVPGINLNGTPIYRFFGGSTMWGEGSDDSRTIPAYFKQSKPDTQVINHGQLAYNSRQNLEKLINLLTQLDTIGTVIFYDGVNDAAFLCPTEIEVPGHRLVPSFKRKIDGDNVDYVLIFLDKVFISNIKRLINRLNYSNQSTLAYNCVGNEEKISQIAQGIIRNWEMAHTLVSNSGGRFVAILQPVAFIGNPEVDYLQLDETLGQNVVAVYKAVQKLIKENNYDWIIDMSDTFDNKQSIYIDFCHVSPLGNKIMADAIIKILEQ